MQSSTQFKASSFRPEPVTKNLFDAIQAIGGLRIVTVMTAYMGAVSYVIQPDNKFGNSPCVDLVKREMFLEHLEESIICFGGAFVRKYQKHSILDLLGIGHNELAECRLFGAVCGRGVWFGLSREKVRKAATTNPSTKEPMPGNPGDTYMDWPGL